MTCGSYLIGTAVCDAGHRVGITIDCPLTPDEHLRTRMPTVQISCPTCGLRANLIGYWVRTDTPLAA